MATSIRDIAVADNYTGNAGIGAPLDNAINLNTRPIEQLAVFSMYAKKYEREKQEAAMQAQIGELSKVSALDWQNAIPEERQAALDIVKKLNDRGKYFATRKMTPTEELAWKSEVNEATKKVANINARFISNGEWLKKIAAETNPAKKKLLEQERDKAVKNTTIDDPLPLLQQYDVKMPEMPKATEIEVPLTKVHPNYMENESHKIWNAEAAVARSNVFALQLNKPIDKDSPGGKRMGIEMDDNVWANAALELNGAIENYKAKNGGVVDKNKVKGVASEIVTLAEQLNAYSTNKNSQIDAGAFGINLKKYPTVNWEDGISPDELALLADFASWDGDKIERKIVETDNAIQESKNKNDLALDWYRAKTGRISANKESGTGKAADVIDKPAFLFGENINRLKKIFQKGNVTAETVQFKSVDPYTRRATGLTEDDEIVYRPDGSYIIQNKTTGEQKTVGTIDNLAQGYINAVKSIDFSGEDKDGTMAEGFQLKSENKFKQIWGTSSGKNIWDNWGNATQKEQATETDQKSTTEKTVSSQTIKSLVGKKGYEGYTEKELMEYYKSNGYIIK